MNGITTEIVDYGSGVQCKRSYENGILRKEIWLKDEIKNRDDDEPTQIEFYENGIIFVSKWYKNGKQHREYDKPAEIYFNKKQR